MKKTNWKLLKRRFLSMLVLTLGVMAMGSIQTNAMDISSPYFTSPDVGGSSASATQTPTAGMDITSPYFIPDSSQITQVKVPDLGSQVIKPVSKWELDDTKLEVTPVAEKEIQLIFEMAGYEMPEFVVLEPIDTIRAPEAIYIMGSIVTKSDLEKAKQDNGFIVIQTAYYSWTIDAKDIAADGLKDIDLGVNIVEIPTIQPAIIHKVSNGNPVKQISLNYHGMFGFTGTLKVNMGARYYGKHGNLFYCMDDGRVEFISSVPIEANGDVNLRFEHASDYLLVMSDEPMSQASVPEELRPLEIGDASVVGSESVNQTKTQLTGNLSQSMTTSNQMKSVKTGDYDMVLPWIISGISTLGIIVYLLKRKKA